VCRASHRGAAGGGREVWFLSRRIARRLAEACCVSRVASWGGWRRRAVCRASHRESAAWRSPAQRTRHSQFVVLATHDVHKSHLGTARRLITLCRLCAPFPRCWVGNLSHPLPSPSGAVRGWYPAGRDGLVVVVPLDRPAVGRGGGLPCKGQPIHYVVWHVGGWGRTGRHPLAVAPMEP